MKVSYDYISLYVQFIISITLIILISIIYLVNQNPKLHKNESRSYNVLPTNNMQCKLYPRLIIWARQIALVSLLLLNIYQYFIEKHIKYETMQYISNVLYSLDLIFVIVFDNIGNLGDYNCNKSWLIIYSIIFLQSACVYLFLQSWVALAILLLALFIVTTAILNTFLDLHVPQINPVPKEFTCGIFDYLTFSYLNYILIKPGLLKDSLELEDVPLLCDEDSAQIMWNRFKTILKNNKKYTVSPTNKTTTSSSIKIDKDNSNEKVLHLAHSIYELVKIEWYMHGFFQLLSSLTTYIAPLALERILLHISHQNRDDDSIEKILPISIQLAVAMLFLGPLVNAITQNQNYMRGRHIGIRVKAALIAAIYQKALVVDLSSSKESVGKLTNLISVDVSEIQSFCAYSHAIWSTIFEVFIGCALLLVVLGNATWGGVFIMVLSMMLGLYLSKKCEVYQEQLLKNKDIRMGIISEVLNSIRVIKYYAWELKFIGKISEARRVELQSLRSYILVGALLHLLWDIVPSVVGATAFIIHTYVLGKELTPSMGFTALTLFSQLRYPLDSFPEMLNYAIRTRVSLRRIEIFLDTKNVKGLPRIDNNISSNSSIQSKRMIGCEVQLKDFSLGWLPTLKADDEVLSIESSSDSNNFTEKINEQHGCYHTVFGTWCSSAMRSTSSLSKLTRNSLNKIRSFSSSSKPYSLLKSNDEESGNFELFSEHGLSMKENGVIGLSENIFNGLIVFHDITISIPTCSLAIIVGVTGSGKSSLLQGAFLGEGIHLQGNVALNGRISYAPQSPWIQNASLRDNILFGCPYEQERYDRVVYSCSLLSDFNILPYGDLTEIGEKGVNLSGGQQQRVSLARAAYSYSDVILLDDCLSAVDAIVAEHIYNELILGFLKDRTRLLVSHNVSLTVPSADLVICIEKSLTGPVHSRIIACCSPSDLPSILSLDSVKHSTASITQQSENTNDFSVFLNNLISSCKLPKTLSPSSYVSPVVKNNQKQFFSYESLSELAKKYQKPNTNTNASKTGSNDLISENSDHDQGKLVKKETKNSGDVGWSLYWYYLKACGGISATAGLILGSLGTTVAWLYQNIALGEWMEAMEKDGIRSGKKTFYLYLLSILIVFICTFLCIASQVISNLVSSKQMHENLVTSVIMSICSWFDATPIGRIVNRFSQDISAVDSNLIQSIYAFVRCVLETFQIVAVITYTLPILLLPFIPIMGFTAWISYQYIHISRELKRLESISKTPVFVLFSETLHGLPVIRAFRDEKRFFKTCFERIDAMNRCHLYMWLCNRWLNFRMQILGAFVAGAVGLTIVLHSDRFGSTLAGVVLVYSLGFCDALTWLTRTHAECQMNLNSVERLQEYSDLESEKYSCNNKNATNQKLKIDSEDFIGINPIHHLMNDSTSSQWPKEGKMEFKQISLKYNSDSVLKSVSFCIPGKNKVGVVGRTGAGKSSLIAALFRICEPYEGELLIDNVNVLDIPLHILRNAIAIVPQDPTLFRGSVRFNLDPFNQYTDEELWNALESAHLAEYVRNMKDNEDIINTATSTVSMLERKQVAEKGSNFSVGQRQLLCMARAVLRKAPILVLDECTASVDHETDWLIQETVRNKLSHCTVLCVAHRLHTIAYYDEIIVMDKGTVVEFADPYTLINTENSIFRNMCKTSGDFEELYELAEQAYKERMKKATVTATSLQVK